MKRLFLVFIFFLFTIPLFSNETSANSNQDSCLDEYDIIIEGSGNWQSLFSFHVGTSASCIIGGLNFWMRFFPPRWGMLPQHSHRVNVEFQHIFNKSYSIIRIGYSHFPRFMTLVGFGFGMSYNITNNDFGIVPSISLSLLKLAFLEYRFNLIPSNTSNNFHEFLVLFTVGGF